MMVLIAHAADIHLGKSFQRIASEERDRDIDEAFRQMLDFIISEHLKILIISGDLFDRPRPSNFTLASFKESVKEFLSSGGRIILVNGDHDTAAESDITATDLVSRYLNGVYHLRHFVKREHELNIEEDGVKLNFFGLGAIRGPRGLKQGQEIMKRINEIARIEQGRNIMVSHISIKEIFPIAEGHSLDSLPSNIDYYALGHIHRRIINNVKDGILAYPGSLEIISRDEIDDWKKKGKGFYIVDLSSREPLVHQVNLDIRPQEKFGISSEKEVQNLVAEVEKYLAQLYSDKMPVIHIELSDEIDSIKKALRPHVDRWQKQGVMTNLILNPSKAETSSIEYGTSGSMNELKIVNALVGDEHIARLIIELKNCLSMSDEQQCGEIAKEITSKKEYWDKALKEWPKSSAESSTQKKNLSEAGLGKFMG
jgi:DNA repair exonuclease SbcCD nuclease subunit